jgi:hypothetical protein
MIAITNAYLMTESSEEMVLKRALERTRVIAISEAPVPALSGEKSDACMESLRGFLASSEQSMVLRNPASRAAPACVTGDCS